MQITEKLKKLGFKYTTLFSSIVLTNTFTNLEYKFQSWEQIEYFLNGYEQGCSKLLGEKFNEWFNKHHHPTTGQVSTPSCFGIASAATGIFGSPSTPSNIFFKVTINNPPCSIGIYGTQS